MIAITHEPLDPEMVINKVLNNQNGAIVTFLGSTRRTTGGRIVLHLEYEAYRPMADKKLAEIANEICDQSSVKDIAIAHRLGLLNIGDISLVVAAAAPHRRDAFAACQKVVDRIKDIVPIWKKEIFEDGEVWVGMEESNTINMD